MELVLKCKASAKFVKKLEAGQVLTVLDLTLVKLIQRSTKLETSPALYSDLLKHIKTVLSRSVELYYRIGANVNLFDFDAQTKFNGYRSLQKLLVTCCRRILNLVIFLQNRKLDQTRFKEIKAWATLLEKLEIMLKMAAQLQARSLDKSTHDCGAEEVSLFVDLNELIDTDVEQQLFDLATIHQEAFFGRTCAFQFSKSLRLPLVAIVVAFTSFHDAHEQRLKTTRSRNNDGQFELRSFMRSMWYNGKKYVTNPELRSKRMCQIVQTTNVDLCKGFWQLTETLVFQTSLGILTPIIAVNVLKRIGFTTPLKLPNVDAPGEFVTIHPPVGCSSTDSITIRVLSHKKFDGMKDLMTPELSTARENASSVICGGNTSRFLIIHAHGGGFIAHTSKSHQVYLKTWCKELRCPIVSIDYSLAPAAVFPRASQQCFYTYAWCLLNKRVLGWTGEFVMCVGDSAGGNLVTNIVQQAIWNGVRVPDLLALVYAPLLLGLSLSPSRLISAMDPLINMSIMWRCLAAYYGVQEGGKDRAKTKTSQSQRPRVLKYPGIISEATVDVIEALYTHELTTNELVSPLISSDSVLEKFPATFLIACNDPLLDDSVEMAKRLRGLNVYTELVVVDNGSAHGFLNMRRVCGETREACEITVQCLKRAMARFEPKYF